MYLMDDVGFMALAENLIRYIDEKYGRAAAWAMGLAVMIAPITLAIVAFYYFTS